MDRPSGALLVCDWLKRFLDEPAPRLLLLVFRGFDPVTPRMMELPRYEAEGAPIGVKLAADDGGGGPAGVVEGLVANISNDRLELRSGVEGGELSGTANRLAMVDEASKLCWDGYCLGEGRNDLGITRGKHLVKKMLVCEEPSDTAMQHSRHIRVPATKAE